MTFPSSLTRGPAAALRLGLVCGALAALAALVGCGTPPVTRLHSLLATTAPGTSSAPETAVAAGRAALVIDLAQVTVPAAVDQPQWLVREPDDSLRLLEQERWASSPRDELRAALAERLRQGFGAVDVRALAPGQPAAGTAVWRVRVEVLRFESIPGREAWLDSAWSVVPSNLPTTTPTNATGARAAAGLSCRSSLREAAPGDLAAIAVAHRRAVLRLADQIGARLAALGRGQNAACGTPDGP